MDDKEAGFLAWAVFATLALVLALVMGVKGCEYGDGGLTEPCYPNNSCSTSLVCFDKGDHQRGVCVPAVPIK